MKKIFSFSLILLSLFFVTLFLPPASLAADIRAGDTVIIPESEKNLNDLYIFGKTVQISAPVTNDIVVAGGDVNLNSSVSDDIIAAGGNLRIVGSSGGSVRIAGGNIIIDSKIGRDLVVAGGNITILGSSEINGDLIANGGEINILGTVNGKVISNGGKVTINGKVGKQVEGNVQDLTIGPNARIGGDLTYSSPQKAKISQGAQINGTEHFKLVQQQQKEPAEKVGAIITTFSIYKLIADIIISLILIYFFRQLLTRMFTKSFVEEPLKNGIYGLIFLIVMPIVSVFLLFLLWLGVVSFLFYAIILIIAVYVSKIFLGWLIVRWSYNRDKKPYILDWKAAVIGPIIVFLISLIPVIGWLFLAIIYLITTGALIREFTITANTQRLPPAKRR